MKKVNVSTKQMGRFAGKKFICPIIFSHELTVSFNLLGREKFFKNFVVIFALAVLLTSRKDLLCL